MVAVTLVVAVTLGVLGGRPGHVPWQRGTLAWGCQGSTNDE